MGPPALSSVPDILNLLPFRTLVLLNTLNLHHRLADELNATHILEGAVFREGNRMRLTLQLIDGLTDKLLWSERYERTLTDALQLQAEVAAAIAGQLVVQLIGVIDTPTTDAVAYDLFLKARVARLTLTGSHPVEDWRRAETLLGEALARDPDFWLAYVERAFIRNFMATNAYPGAEGTARLATCRSGSGPPDCWQRANNPCRGGPG